MENSDKTGKSKSFTTPGTQKNMAARLLAEDRLFGALAEQSSDIIILVNREGVVIYENNAVEGILGFKITERIGGKAFDYVHPDELNSVTGKFHALFADQKNPTKRDEVRICDIDGNWHHFEVVASRLRQNKTVAAVIINLRDITQRRKAEEELRRSEEKYRSILENMSEGYYEINPSGDIVFANDSGCAMLGYDRETILHLNYRQYSTPETKKRFHNTFSEVFRTGASIRMEDYEIIRQDGSIRIHQLSVGLIRDAEGMPSGFRSVARDVTEKRLAEAALRESEARYRAREERYRSILDNMEEAYYEVDLKGNMTFCNAAAVKNLGYTDSEMMGINFHQYVDEENAGKVREAFHNVYFTGTTTKGVDWEAISKTGGRIPVESSISLMRDAPGNPIGFRGIIRDITGRKQAEAALRESEARSREREERYRSILDNMEEAYYEVDLKGNLTFFNTAAVKNLGYTDSEMMGMNFRQYVDGVNAARVIEAYKKVFLSGESTKGVDWELISKTGGRIPIESSISLIRDEQGNPIGFRGVIRDITERKQAEAALRESEEKFRNFTETAQDAIVTTDLNGIITYANPAARALTADMAVVGTALVDFLPPDPPEQHLNVLESINRNFSTPMSYESKIMGAQDDCPMYFDVKSSTLSNCGMPAGILFVARDATARKRTEEEIRRMAVIDTLTGLYNRRGFIALAEQQMKTAVRNAKKLLLFFIDLDGLKFVNDTWGHEEGDRAIKRTAVILKKTFRETDIISRLGGDEFAAMVVDSPELPEVILKRMQGRTDDENTASDVPYQITMSVGVADYDPSTPRSIHELMSHADQLMYRQKKTKKKRMQYPYR